MHKFKIFLMAFFLCNSLPGQVDSSQSNADSINVHDDISLETNPIFSKNYITETAIGLRENEAYLHMPVIPSGSSVIPNFGIGLSDHFSINGGGLLFLGSGLGSVFNLGGKLSFPIAKDVTIAGGVNFGTSTGGEAAIPIYGVVTYGNKSNNLTLGVAVEPINVPDFPVFQIGGSLQLGSRIYLVTDNLVVVNDSDAFGVYSFLLRVKTSRKVAFEAGVGGGGSDSAILLGIVVN